MKKDKTWQNHILNVLLSKYGVKCLKYGHTQRIMYLFRQIVIFLLSLGAPGLFIHNRHTEEQVSIGKAKKTIN